MAIRELDQYVISHKYIDDKRFNNRKLLYVNQLIKKNTSNGDETWKFDNIDYLNPFYCELTALYWIWKNVKEVEYISIEHYRRVFISSSGSIAEYKLLTKKEISDILRKYSIILPRNHWFKNTLYREYENNHIKKDMDLMIELINKSYPEYNDSVNKIMTGQICSLFNMAVIKKSDFDEYCKFTFDILNRVFDEIKDENAIRSGYQSRTIGFLAERLFNIWVNNKFNEEEIYRCSIGHLEQNSIEHNLKNIAFKLLKRNHDI